MSSAAIGAALAYFGIAQAEKPDDIQCVIIDEQESEAVQELAKSFGVIEEIINDIPPLTQQDA